MAVIDYISLLAELVAIDSRNPALNPGCPGETEIAKFTAAFLTQHGFETAIVEPVAGRPSVFGRLAGTGGGQTLMFNGHYDTVDFGAMADPLKPTIANGRLYGRGSYDMKGGLAAVLAAGAQLAAGPRLRGDILIAAVADEEHASLGTAAVLDYMTEHQIHADLGIVAEPTEMQLCVAHKGFVWATITTNGRAAHGSDWQHGIDAITHMGRILVALDAYDQGLHKRTPHPFVGPPSMHASLISGGNGLSTYPPTCTLQLERRFIPGETLASVTAEYEAILAAFHAADPQAHATLEIGLARQPMEAGLESPIVQAIEEASRAIIGALPTRFGMAAWTDAALMAGAGIPSVLFGPTGTGAHADEEWVDLSTVAQCIEIYCNVANKLCQ